MGLVAAFIVVTTGDTPLFWTKRVGLHNILFDMPKFRTMRAKTPQIATHLMADPNLYLTPIGRFLRQTSLDELPQLWSVLKGDMSLVGPRPALFNQDDLVALRTEAGVHELVPGITGWAQINGRDELSVSEKVRFEKEYLQRCYSLKFDAYILMLTLVRVFRKCGVSH
jgi:O-antigen biosynthesis protein WbqP